MLNTDNILSLINGGEGYNIEFKVRVPSKVRELTEEICAFANANGGYLLIGVDDNGQVVGTNLENDKRSAIQGSISEISPALRCELYSVNIEDKTVWVIDVPSGKDKPYIFSGSIYVREGANSQKLRTVEDIIRKSKFPQNPKRSVRFSGKGTKRSVQKRKARNTQKTETKGL